MDDQPASNSNLRPARIGAILNELLDRRARGEAVSESELLARHPDLADELRAHFKLLDGLTASADPIETLIQRNVLTRAGDPGWRAELDGYRIIGVIGGGGMGVVLEGCQPALDRRVAIKFLRPEWLGDGRAASRFLREARAVAALNHPNVVTLYDFGQRSGASYLVMEYVEGESLADHLRRHGPLPAESARHIFRQLLEALAAAHAVGVIHRDVKPSNILLHNGDGAPPRVKLADFGLAKSLEGDGRSMVSVAGHGVGTPDYMSPEQARGDADVDHRSDLYSAGVVLYEMLSGRAPMLGDSVPSMAAELRGIAGVAPELARLMVCLLARDRDARPPSAVEALHSVEGRQIKSVRAPRNLLACSALALAASAIAISIPWYAPVWRHPPAAVPLPSQQSESSARDAIASAPASETRRVKLAEVHDIWPPCVRLVFEDGETKNFFPTWRFEPKSIRSVDVADLANGEQVIVVGTDGPIGDYQATLCGVWLDGTVAWTKDMRSDKVWPESVDKKTYWITRLVRAADLDGVPGDELVVAANHRDNAPARISIVDAVSGEIRQTLWLFGQILGLRVVPKFFGERPAILAWGYNNALDGFRDGLREGETCVVHWSDINCLLVIDPSRIEGMGPPRTNPSRWSNPAESLPAGLHAYAVLDVRIDPEKLYRDMGDAYHWPDVCVRFETVDHLIPPPAEPNLPAFEVTLKSEPATQKLRATPKLILDRILTLVGVGPHPEAAPGEGRLVEDWRPYWRVIVLNGEYVDP